MVAFDFDFIRRIDLRFIAEEVKLHARPFRAVAEWMKENGISGSLTANGIQETSSKLYSALYPTGDFFMPVMMLGVASFRYQPYRVRVPIVYGEVKINPAELIEISDVEKRIIFNDFENEYYAGLYSACDLLDFAYAVDDLKVEESIRQTFATKSKSALESSAATLLQKVQQDMVLQQSLIACELSIKSALSSIGFSEKDLKKLGHNVGNLAKEIIRSGLIKEPEIFDQLCEACPNLVETRYGKHGFGDKELIQFTINAQFICSQAIQTYSESRIGDTLQQSGDLPDRKSIWSNLV